MPESENQQSWVNRTFEFFDELTARFTSQNTLIAARRSTTIVISLFASSLALKEHQKFDYYFLSFDFSSIHLSISLLIVASIFMINLIVHYLYNDYKEGTVIPNTYIIFKKEAIFYKAQYKSVYQNLKKTSIKAINEILVNRIVMDYSSDDKRDEIPSLLNQTNESSEFIFISGETNIRTVPFGPELDRFDREMISKIFSRVRWEIWKFRVSIILREIGYMSRYVFVPLAIYLFSLVSLILRVGDKSSFA